MSDDRFRPPEAPLRDTVTVESRGRGRGLPDAIVIIVGLLLTHLASYSVAPVAAEVLAALLLPMENFGDGFAVFLFADVMFSTAVVLGFLLLARALSQSGSARVIHWLAGLLFASTPLVRLWIGEYAALAGGRGFPLWYEATLLAVVPAAWGLALWWSRRRTPPPAEAPS
jgi:hypothetical protein